VRPNTRKAAFTALNGVEIAHLAVSLGSSETLIEHPRSMTHSDMSIEDLDKCGIEEGMMRVSVGLESSKDLIKDLLSALDLIQDDT
jgi:methionine-gamma-lyase